MACDLVDDARSSYVVSPRQFEGVHESGKRVDGGRFHVGSGISGEGATSTSKKMDRGVEEGAD